MSSTPLDGLSRRERQVMKVVFAEEGSLSAEEIRARLPDAPSNPGTRSILRRLVERGRLRIELDGRTYRYLPVEAGSPSRLEALADTVRTFFGGSVTEAAAALVELSGEPGAKEDADVRLALEGVLRRRARRGSSPAEPDA